MENKDDLISRRAALDIVAKDSGMADTYDRIEALPGQMTATEAWEIARRITRDEVLGGFSNKEIGEIFDTVYPDEIFNRFTPEEAERRIAEWEKGLTIHKDQEEVIDSCKIILEDFMKSSRQ